MSAKWHYAIKTWQTKIWKPVFALSKLLLLDTHSTQVIRRYRLIFCSHLELNQFSSFPEVVIKKRPCISCNICCKLFQRMFSDPVKRKWVRWSNFNINIKNNFLNKKIFHWTSKYLFSCWYWSFSKRLAEKESASSSEEDCLSRLVSSNLGKVSKKILKKLKVFST